ncbi:MULTISPECIES: class III extradiol dioxygenase subunit B-like domain-containing protein [unclassified Frankia]
MTLVAAAVCPHPPLLVPEVGCGEPIEARAVAVDAVRLLCATKPDTIVVVGDAATEVSYGPAAFGSLAGFGVDLRVDLGPTALAPESPSVPSSPVLPSPPLPLSITIGAWLLGAVGWPGARTAVGVPAEISPDGAVALGSRLVAGSAPQERLALLVMGDGSACRTLKAPGGLDPRAAAFDATAAAALAAGDPAGLLALDPGLARELLAAGRASWQVLAGALLAATRDGPGPGSLGPGAWNSDLRYDDAPYGVGYLVALWTRDVAERG